MTPNNHDKVPVCKILYFVEGYGTVGGVIRWGMHHRTENGRHTNVTLRAHPT
jgi:hypothetical protein